jgi:nitroreductase
MRNGIPMNVSDAISSRQSVRAFTDQPVELATIREILEMAGRAPSGSNLQPWKVHVVAGDPTGIVVDVGGNHPLFTADG